MTPIQLNKNITHTNPANNKGRHLTNAWKISFVCGDLSYTI